MCKNNCPVVNGACRCFLGLTGQFCENLACGNGTVIIGASGYTCACNAGYQQALDSQGVPYCQSSQCGAYGVPADLDAPELCVCDAGYNYTTPGYTTRNPGGKGCVLPCNWAGTVEYSYALDACVCAQYWNDTHCATYYNPNNVTYLNGSMGNSTGMGPGSNGSNPISPPTHNTTNSGSSSASGSSSSSLSTTDIVGIAVGAAGGVALVVLVFFARHVITKWWGKRVVWLRGMKVVK